jgi:hypothetical protein
MKVLRFFIPEPSINYHIWQSKLLLLQALLAT